MAAPSYYNDRYDPVPCYRPQPRGTHISLEGKHEHDWRRREENGVELVANFARAKAPKSVGGGPGQMTRDLCHSFACDEALNNSRKDYDRGVQRSFSLATKLDTNIGISQNEGISSKNEIASLMGNSAVSYGARRQPTAHRQGTRVNSVPSYAAQNIMAPSLPASAPNYQSKFFNDGLLSGGGRGVRSEPIKGKEANEMFEKRYVQNLAVVFDFRGSSEYSEETVHEAKPSGLDPTNTVLPRIACVHGYHKGNSDNYNEFAGPVRLTDRQIEMSMADLGTQRGWHKRRHQSDEAKVHSRITGKSRCVESCDPKLVLTQETTNVRVPPSSPRESIVEEDTIAGKSDASLKYTSNASHAEGNPDHCEIEDEILHESRAREERIRNLKMLQTEKEKALDKLLLTRVEREVISDAKTSGKSRNIKSTQGCGILRQEHTNSDRFEKLVNASWHGTDVLSATEEKEKSTGPDRNRRKKLLKYKAPKKRWLKIWKARGRISNQNATKEMAARNKKAATNDNQDLSSDEFTALIGLVNLGKS